MTDAHTFYEPNDLDSMISNLPDQSPVEEETYDPTWDATPEFNIDPMDQVSTDPAVVDEPEVVDDDSVVAYVQPVNNEPAVVDEDTTADEETFSTEEVVLTDSDPWATYIDDGVYGNAFAWQNDWYWQGDTQYCGPTSVSFILNQFYGTGIFDPTVLVNQGIALGIDDTYEDGTSTYQIEQLLEANGVDATMEQANPEDPLLDLATKLEEGRGVIATVDAWEIWGTLDPTAATNINWTEDDPNHALVVSEINTKTGLITLSDPGHPEGNRLEIDFATFLNAWADSNYQMVSTNGINGELRDTSLQPVGADFTIVNATGHDKV